MREIKFRYIYQHEEDSDFPEFSLQIADTRDSTWTLEQISEGEPDNYISVCLSSSWKVIAINQYTGLKDKNGKEIYEGDIVQGYFNHGMQFREGAVKFSIGRFIVHGLTGVPLYEFLEGNNMNLEIIGNIYENPELLNN